MKMRSQVFFIQANGKESFDVLANKVEKVFLKMGWEEKIETHFFTALKIHFGEKGTDGYIKPQWLSKIIERIKKRTSHAYLTDTNTLYLGSRSNTLDHIRLANDHGFGLEALGIPVVIADGLIGRDDDEIQVNLSRIQTAKIASAFLNSDMLLCLNHFTGHILTGFGAALKNLGMGCASRAGKLEQHSDVHPWIKPQSCNNCLVCRDYCPEGAIVQEKDNMRIIEDKCIGCGECLVVCNFGAVKMRWDEDTVRVQEKMAEYAYGIWRSFNGKAGFLNFLIKLNKDCDCMPSRGKALADDIGILSSIDPVAVDKASVDLIIDRSGRDVIRDANNVDWSVQLEHGAEIGLGSMEYDLEEIS